MHVPQCTHADSQSHEGQLLSLPLDLGPLLYEWPRARYSGTWPLQKPLRNHLGLCGKIAVDNWALRVSKVPTYTRGTLGSRLHQTLETITEELSLSTLNSLPSRLLFHATRSPGILTWWSQIAGELHREGICCFLSEQREQ